MSWGRGGGREMKFETRNSKIGGEKRRGVERKGSHSSTKNGPGREEGEAGVRAR